jgi:hypothetical protein
MGDEEFERRTLDTMHSELGLGGLARFIQTFRSNRGDYTAERHHLLGFLTIDQSLTGLKNLQPIGDSDAAEQKL